MWVMQGLMHIGCGALVGIGLVFLLLGRISENEGDDCGSCVAVAIAAVSFLMAAAVFWLA
jgi:hypothetical protein